MVGAALASTAARPKAAVSRGEPRVVLEHLVPANFGTWKQVQSPMPLVNPQTQQLLDKLYSQVLNRTYINGDGYRIMLSLAYGDDQRGGMQAHMPEVCYPAQGFSVHDQARAELETPYGALAVRRLRTSLGAREEPVTYWFTFGAQALRGDNRLEKRLIEIRFGLTGQVPDGLLFRVSSIDSDALRAYPQHDRFVQDLLASLSPADRARLGGLRQ